MVTDMCTRIWRGADPLSTSEGEPSSESTPSAHQQAMHCVDQAVVVGYRCSRLGVDLPNESLAAFVQGDPVRRFGLAGIDVSAPEAIDELESVKELGLSGAAIALADQGVRPTDDRAMRVFERCAELGLPVMFANPQCRRAESILEYARPALLDEVMRSIPNLRVVLGDLGRAFMEEAFALLAKHEHVFAEISTVVRREWTLRRAMLEAWDRGVIDKLLFGSGFPLELPERAIARVYGVSSPSGMSVMPNVPRPLLRGVVENRALTLLGIEHESAQRRPEIGVTRAGRSIEVIRAP